MYILLLVLETVLPISVQKCSASSFLLDYLAVSSGSYWKYAYTHLRSFAKNQAYPLDLRANHPTTTLIFKLLAIPNANTMLLLLLKVEN